MIDDKKGDIVDVDCDCGQEHRAIVLGDQGQLLEWECPVLGLMRDPNVE